MRDSGTDTLLSEDRGAVRIIRMNRPEKLNALNTALTRSLRDGLRDAEADESVRAVVLAGEGRAFCAGADLSEFAELTPTNQDLVARRAALTVELQMLPRTMSKPIVSAVQGAAIGGGAGLAIGCDMMVASTDLKFGYPEVGHSIVPAIVMTGLQRQVGAKLAFEMLSLGRLLGAGEVLDLGLANRIAAPDEALEGALEIANVWAAATPRALTATKELFNRVADLPYAEAMRAGRDVNMIMRGFPGEPE
ncbi:MAG TPA: enoyl-CoA hydratase/isomerase family protein [Solirubrobacterales bacterium]|jgi:enoyl-CoA hydratase/carnithine racemase